MPATLRRFSLINSGDWPLRALSSPSKPYETRYPDIIAAYAYAASGHKPRRPLIYRLSPQQRVIWRQVRRLAVRSPGWGYLGLGSLAALMVLGLQLRPAGWGLPVAGASPFVNATTYFAAIGLAVGGYSAWLLSKQNQANFVKDYMSKFLEKKEVYESWRYLFYLYKNSDFQLISAVIEKSEADQRAAGSKQIKLSFDLIASFNEDRKKHGDSKQDGKSDEGRAAEGSGLRRWHPQLLPESPEEGRVDEVLSYFNVLGDYYERGSLDVDEIGDVATFYLRAIGNCEAFRSYLTLIMEVFSEEGSAVRERYGYPSFGNLCLLLNDLEILRDEKETAFYDRYRHHMRNVPPSQVSRPTSSKSQD